MTARDTISSFATAPVTTAATTSCWCCARRIGLGARRCRHCGVPQETSRAIEALASMPTPPSTPVVTLLPGHGSARPSSALARPASARAMLLSAIGLVAWCAMLAA